MSFQGLKKIILASLLLMGIFSPLASAENIEIITDASNSVTHLDQREVRAIFSMRLKTWSNNTPVQVFVLEQNQPVHEQFCKEILKIFPHQLQAGWDRLVFSGTGEAPKVVSTEEQMVAAVRSTPGSIGYVSANFIQQKEANHESANIHVISIQ